MIKKIGIRREDKNEWEKRVPITPSAVQQLSEQNNIEFIVQPSEKRVFNDNAFLNSKAVIDDNLNDCDIILGVKEIPSEKLIEEKIYLFFSHTIKGQDYNMPLLKEMMSKKITLIDYECIKNDEGMRAVFFGKHAGYAGMIDTIFGLGQRLKSLGYNTPFLKINHAYRYANVSDAKDSIESIKKEIQNYDFPEIISPLVFAFAGYGNVSKGAQEILDILDVTEISPEQLLYDNLDKNEIYKVIFKESDLVENVEDMNKFDLNEYYQYPERYKSKFYRYFSKISVLINAVYWDERYPRLLTRDFIKSNYKNSRLVFIGDFSVDINGAIEFTDFVTEPDNMVFIYNPGQDKSELGFEGEGIAVLAVDNLPAEIPEDSSIWFSQSLEPYIKELCKTDFSGSFENLDLLSDLKNAVILYKGKLTPEYTYIKEFIK